MPVITYDPSKVIIVCGVAPLGGFAEDSFATLEFEDDLFKTHKGADGEIGRSKMVAQMATLTVTLAMTSPFNALLNGFYALDKLANGGKFPVLITDELGTAVACPAAWISHVPNVEYSTEISEWEWKIAMPNADFLRLPLTA